jgi:hypothetical protein
MARPVTPKPLSEHRLILVRMQQSVEVDASIDPKKKKKLLEKIEHAVAEFGSAMSGA